MGYDNRLFYVLTGAKWKKRFDDFVAARNKAISDNQATLRSLTGCDEALAMRQATTVWIPSGVALGKEWRQVGRSCKWTPRLNTKAGKALLAAMSAMTPIPDDEDFVREHFPGWDGFGVTGSHAVLPRVGYCGGKLVLSLFDCKKNRDNAPVSGMKPVPPSTIMALREKDAVALEATIDT